MAKDIIHINDFSGGNRLLEYGTSGILIPTSNVDSRDVKDNELINMVDCEVIEGGRVAITRGIVIEGAFSYRSISPGRGLFLYDSDFEGADEAKEFFQHVDNQIYWDGDSSGFAAEMPARVNTSYLMVGDSNTGAVHVFKLKSYFDIDSHEFISSDISIGLDKNSDLSGGYHLEFLRSNNIFYICDANFEDSRHSRPVTYGFINYSQFPSGTAPGQSENSYAYGSQAHWRGHFRGECIYPGPRPYLGVDYSKSDVLFGATPRFHPLTYMGPPESETNFGDYDGDNEVFLGLNGGIGVHFSYSGGASTPEEGGGFPGYWQFGMTYIYGDGVSWDLDAGIESSIHWGIYNDFIDLLSEQGEGNTDLPTIGYGLWKQDADGTNPKSLQFNYRIKNFIGYDTEYGYGDEFVDSKLGQRQFPGIDKRIIGSRVYIREWKEGSSVYAVVSDSERCLAEARFTQNIPQSWIDRQEEITYGGAGGGNNEVRDLSPYFDNIFHKEATFTIGGLRKRGGEFYTIPDLSNMSSSEANTQFQWTVAWEGQINSGVESNQIEVMNYTDLVDTYFSINGYESDSLLDLGGPGDGWVTSTIYSNRAFIGNVKSSNNVYPDTIFKGIPDKGMHFLKDSYIKVESDDGDQITCLKVYNQKLLCFKEKTLYIFDISTFDDEKLEETKYGMGADHQSSVVETPYGIAWRAATGTVYLYDGNDILDLTVNKDSGSEQFTSAWSGLYLGRHMIGYDPSFDELIFMPRADGDDSSVVPFSPIIRYGFKTGLWNYTRRAGNYEFMRRKEGGGIIGPADKEDPSKGRDVPSDTIMPPGSPIIQPPDRFPDDFVFRNKSNILSLYKPLLGVGGPRALWGTEGIDWFDQPVDNFILLGSLNYIGTELIPYLAHNPKNLFSTSFEFSTKEFDLGSPDVRKKVYKVYCSYKNPVETIPSNTDYLYDQLPKLFVALNGQNTYNSSNNEENPSLQHWVPIGAFEKTTIADGWVRKEFKFSNDTAFPQHDYNNVYTIQLKVARGSYPQFEPRDDSSGYDFLTNPGFEVNDISIVYRSKSIK